MKNHKLPSRIEVDRIKLGKKVEVGHAFPVRKPEGFRKGDFIDPLSADQVQDVHLISSLREALQKTPCQAGWNKNVLFGFS